MYTGMIVVGRKKSPGTVSNEETITVTYKGIIP